MTLPADTLRPDTLLLTDLRADNHYDYARELLPDNTTSIGDFVSEKTGSVIAKFFEALGNGEPKAIIVITAVACLLAVLTYFVVRYRRLFFGKKAITDSEPDNADNIYGRDFAAELAEARTKGDFRQVVRLTYLQTLRALADEKRIDWQPSKTPTQYTYEVKDAVFRQMTNNFLRVRYGNYPADEAMAEDMARWAEAMAGQGNGQKGGSQ